jgi:hypothetical protein
MHTTPQHQQSPEYASARPRRRRRWPWVVLAIVGALVALIVVAIVTADGKPTPAPSAGAQQPSTAATVRAVASAPPDAGQRADYLATLAGIDPGLVVNEGRAIARGQRVCEQILHKTTKWTITRYTIEELSGGNATINATQARQVIKAVKVWCR